MVMTNAPVIVPIALPRPPNKLIPPSTTAAMEVRMNTLPVVASPAVVAGGEEDPAAADKPR